MPDKIATPAEAIAAHGLTVESIFVPLSQSRNADSDWPSLNWKVTVKRNGRDVLTTDYSAGLAHAPGYAATFAPRGFWPRNYRNQHGKTRTATKAEGLSQWREYLTKAEAESGFAMTLGHSWSQGSHAPELRPLRKKQTVDGRPVSRPVAIEPNALDVIHSLVMDSNVLDAGGFESWASDYGYDTDSIKARATYDSCLELALAMRAGLGGDALAELAEAFQDY